jgi:DNA-binding MarR family transcriptional regulator
MFRIVSEQAKKLGLNPLEHQALIQIYGSESQGLQMKQIAGQLDIPSDFVSRLVKSLDSKGLVLRSSSTAEKRIVQVRATVMGI